MGAPLAVPSGAEKVFWTASYDGRDRLFFFISAEKVETKLQSADQLYLSCRVTRFDLCRDSAEAAAADPEV